MSHSSGIDIIGGSFASKSKESPLCDKVGEVGGRNRTPRLVNPLINLSLESKSWHMSVMKPNPNPDFLENLKPITLNPLTLKSYYPTVIRILALVLVQLILQGCWLVATFFNSKISQIKMVTRVATHV
jgi:hypothetical protein